MSAIHRPGYRYQLTQPSVILSLQVKNPASVNLRKLDLWLSDSLEVDLQPIPSGQPILGDRDIGDPLIAVIWRILQLGASLQRHAGFPAFEVGEMLGIEADPSQPARWLVRVAVPGFDDVAPSATALVYKGAIKLVLTYLKSGDGEELPPLLQEVDQSCIAKLREQAPSGVSTVPVLQAAFDCCVPFRHLTGGIYHLGWGCRGKMIERSSVGADSVVGAKVSNHKQKTATLLAAAGLPTVSHHSVANKIEALKAAEALGWPVVVKPTNCDRGEGVTVDIHSTFELKRAYQNARSHSMHVLVEKQVPGVCHRLFVANGKFLYALRRAPPSVIGDGASTIEELVKAAQQKTARKPPWLAGKVPLLDAAAREAIVWAGIDTEQIPEPGQIVPLRKFESTRWGGRVEAVTEQVHPDNIGLAEQAARLLGLANAGIDLITTDICQPWHSIGAKVNEINYSPHFGGHPEARARMSGYMEQFMNADGRIPIEVFVGADAALHRARERQQALLNKGIAAYLTDGRKTLTDNGEELILMSEGCFDRARALLLNREVGALLLVVNDEEWLDTGLPIDVIDRLEDLRQSTKRENEALEQVIELLKDRLSPLAHGLMT